MSVDNFLKRKNDILDKIDKSSKGSWDLYIRSLCEKLNESDCYYTTSSCAGRIVVMIDQEKKAQGLFVFVSHEKISFDELKESIESSDKTMDIKFKQDPCILHVACRDIDSAKELYTKAKIVGWKRSGIISLGRNIIVELNSTEKLEFPVIRNGKILVSDEFLKVIVDESNAKLEKSWIKINKLEKSI